MTLCGRDAKLKRSSLCKALHNAKNSLFAGSDSGGTSWSIVASLIETAKMNGVDPFAYLQDVFRRMVAGHPFNRLDELLPWTWKNLPANQAS